MGKRLIPESHWRRFKRPNGTWNGIEFERLVSCLLKESIGGTWEKTQDSWDGSRDFVLRNRDMKAWAECKMWDGTVGLSPLSPTFVMAVNEEVDHILIFSYSRLSENAILQVARFAWRESKRATLFHGAVLDSLILSASRCWNLFSDLERIPFDGTLPPTFTARVSDDLTDEIESLPGIPTSAHTSYYVGRSRLMCIEVVLTNPHPSKRVSGKIELLQPSVAAGKGQYIFVIPPEIPGKEASFSDQLSFQFSLEPAGVAARRVLFRPPTITGSTPLPQLRMGEVVASPGELVPATKLESKLVGESRTALLNAVRKRGMYHAKPSAILLQGGTGVGKSRLLREIQRKFVEAGYRTIWLDGTLSGSTGTDAEQTRETIRTLVRKLLRLPAPGPQNGILYQPEACDSLGKLGQNGPVLSDVHRLLYDPEFQVAESYEYSLGVCTEILRFRGQGCAIFIDNVQDYSSKAVAFLTDLLERVVPYSMQVSFILAINIETWKKTGPVGRLANWITRVAQQSETSFQSFTIRDFNPDEAKDFVNNLVAPDGGCIEFSTAYPDLFSRLMDQVVPRPLHLQQALLHVEDCEGVRIDTGSGLLKVADETRFSELLRSAFVRGDFESLMRQRWEIIAKGWNIRQRAGLRLLMLLRRVRIEDASSLGVCRSHVQDFIARGLLRAEDGYYVPYHGQVHQVLLTIWDPLKFDSRDNLQAYRMLLRHLDPATAYGDTLRACFVAQMATGTLSRSLLERARTLADSDRDDALNTLFLKTLHKAGMNLENGLLSGNERIELLTRVSESLRHSLSYADARPFFEQTNRLLTEALSELRNSSAAVRFRIMLANSQFTGHSDDVALELLKPMQAILPSSDPDLDAEYFDRLCVAQKSVGQLRAAATSGRRALRIATRVGNRFRQVFAYIDIANIFQNGCLLGEPDDITSRGKSHVRRAVDYWKRAKALFDATPGLGDDNGDFMPMVELYAAQAALLEDRPSDAISISDTAINACKNNHRAFFGVKHLIMRSLANWRLEGHKPGPHAVAAAAEARQWSLRDHVTRYIWMCWHLEARIALAYDRQEEAFKAYRCARNELFAAAKNNSIHEYHYHFFDDFMLMARNFRWLEEGEALGYVPPRFKTRYRRLWQATDAEFAEILDSYRPTARFHNGKFNLPSV